MNKEQTEWIQSVGGQQAVLSVYRKILSKQSNINLTLKDFRPSIVLTDKQIETVVDHLVKIDVINEIINELVGHERRTFTIYR